MQRFEMTQKQFTKIMDASKATPAMYLPGGKPMFRSQQENANDAWEKLGKELGFDFMTVRPSGEGDRIFLAEPTT